MQEIRSLHPYIEFKYPHLEAEAALSQPEAVAVLNDFAEHSFKQGWPGPVVTEALRTKRMNRDYYRGHIDRLRKLPKGQLTPSQRLLVQLQGQDFERWLDAKWTWHFVACAFDLRRKQYTADEMPLIKAWFIQRLQLPTGQEAWAAYLRDPARPWEFLIHDVTAPHIHFARRDAVWRAHFEVGRSSLEH